METDWAIVACRFGLFATLGLLFGVPAFGVYACRGLERWIPLRPIVLVLALGAVALSILTFALQVAAMSDATLGTLDRDTIAILLGETALGWALLARLAALLAVLAAGLFVARRPAVATPFIICLAGIALATLAWSGHGGATPGGAGYLHLLSDIVHLLAMAAWSGALAIFLVLVARIHARADMVLARTTHRALAGFASSGTILVALIVASGLLNGALIVGPGDLAGLGAAPYGRLLILKVLLFVGMLALASANRFRLTPALDAAIETGDVRLAARALRRSLAAEFGLALAILALVAWFGTLTPPGAGA